MSERNIETELLKEAEKTAACLTEKLKGLSLKLALAESCTAGLVSSLLGSVPGVSNVLWGSFICYTKEAKVFMLGLDEGELDACGHVSRETACSMADAALQKSGAGLAAAVTGFAGPDGGGSGVPVGTVWIAVSFKNGVTKADKHHFTGSRNEVRIRAAIAVLESISESYLT